MNRIEVNVLTGEQHVIELTAEEVAAIEAAAAQEAAQVPFSVSRFKARAALLNAGLLDQVETLMSAADTPALAKLAWTDATEFERASPTVATMGAALGLDDAALDALFIAAAKITA